MLTDETHKPYTDADLGRVYRDTRERITALIRELSDDALKTMVPACPAWSVRDLVAHLAANAEDVASGVRRTKPPSDEETAAQIERMRDRSVPLILAGWEKDAPIIDAAMASRMRTLVIDITSHEHDLRSALSLAGARDSEAVRLCSMILLQRMRPPVPLRVVVEDAEYHVGPEAEHVGPEVEAQAQQQLVLTTTRFEALRWRMGRRSAAQLAAMQWSADPAAVLGKLVVFGPADADVVE